MTSEKSELIWNEILMKGKFFEERGTRVKEESEENNDTVKF